MKLKRRRKQLTSGKALVYIPGGAKVNLTDKEMEPPPLTYRPLVDTSNPPVKRPLSRE